MVIENTIVNITQQLINFFIPEILFWIFIEKTGNKFKFRFSGVEDYPYLRPFANTWAVGIVSFIIYIFSTPIFEFILGTKISSSLISLGLLKLLLLTISLGAFTLIFLVNYLFEKKLDKNTVIFGLISIVSFIIFLLMIYYDV